MNQFFTEFLNTFTELSQSLYDILWGPIMLVLLLGTGIYLTLGLKFFSFTKIAEAFRLMWHGRQIGQHDKGEVSSFNALMMALAATIGTGNIAGVATAIFLGGPGALFWMWMTALAGMATKYAETVLAVEYREVTDKGSYVGGPMYFIKNGLGKNWKWLGSLFALVAALASFGIGSTVQANSVASAIESTFKIPTYVTGIALFLLSGLIIIGGVKRIAEVSGKFVPFMAFFYCLAGLAAILINIKEIPAAFMLIMESAFTPTAQAGGFAGATIMMAMRYGVARGLFSNEAGLGSGCIAYATAATTDPVRMGLIGMLGTFIDSIIVCSITGFAIILSGLWTTGESGSALTSIAFASSIPYGDVLVTLSIALFAYSTILGWCVYGERCIIFLFGEKFVYIYRFLYVASVPVGAIASLDLIWLVADNLNAMMAIPNLIGLILLSPVVFKLTKKYLDEVKK